MTLGSCYKTAWTPDIMILKLLELEIKGLFGNVLRSVLGFEKGKD
jgi:hypothetical protein